MVSDKLFGLSSMNVIPVRMPYILGQNIDNMKAQQH